MPISFYQQFPEMSTEQAEEVLQGLNLNGKSPEGQIMHLEGPLEAGGTWVMDCWESPEALGRFVEQQLAPAMQRLGVTPPQPQLLQTRAYLTPQQLQKF